MPKVTTRFAHAGAIAGLAYTPDGSNIITAGDDYGILVFPQKDDNFNAPGETIAAQETNTCLVATKNAIYTGSPDGRLQEYSLGSKEFVGIKVSFELAIRCLVMSPNGTYIAVGLESPEIRIVNLEDPENCWSFRGHKKAVNSMSFDPQGQFLVSSSCDGTVIVWNMQTKSKEPLERITITSPMALDSPIQLPVSWHPSGEFFVVGTDVAPLAYLRDTWKKSFTYKGGSTKPTACLAWSPNGRFLATASSAAEICVWQYKAKESPLHKHKHSSGGVTGIVWCPIANRLIYSDTNGEFSRWEDVIEDSANGSPFTITSKKDPLADIFDDPAPENQIQDDEMMQDDDIESLGDFIVDDDNGGYLEKKPAGVAAGGSKPAAKMQIAKELHPQFQSGSTSKQDDKRYLDFNLLGLIKTVDHGTHATVSVEFHDKLAQRGYHFTDNSHYSMACLGVSGSLFAALSKDGNPSTIFYKTNDSWATKSEWQVYLPEGEDATAIALNAESAIVATSRGYVRIFSQSGIQTGLFCVGSVIAAAGKDDMVLLVYHQGEPFAGSQNLGYAIHNVETGQRIQHGSMPVSDATFVTWLGFSDGGIPAFYDDNGVMYVLNYYRRVEQGQWTPILDTSLMESETGVRHHYWPVGLSDLNMTCVKCKKGEVEPSFHATFMSEVPLKMPTLYQNTDAGQNEEAWLRQKILTGLNKDERMAMSIERSDNIVAQKEVQMDKLIIAMINLACKADRAQKALDLTTMLCNLRSIDAAVKVAHHHNLHSLMERMNKVKEIKMLAEEDRDPDAEADMIMANPVLVAPTTRDESAYRVTSRIEEQELEQRTFQRREPVQANDPFGRRVVKESSNSNARGSSTTANPFKKKPGSNADPSAPKGFGNVVRESDDALPISRRANNLFDAADILANDDQRSRNEREKLSRAEESLRKRKANGAASGSGTRTAAGGGQKTLQMFGQPSVSAEAKRFKKQLEQDGPEQDDYDMPMDADDYLEGSRNEDEDELEESQPSAAQRIPGTQEEDLDVDLDDTIEETRGHLENTRVASSLSPVRSSTSSTLAGFRFNKA